MYQSGEQIYKYTLGRKIGGGHFGEVWTAKDAALDTDIAVKLLPNANDSIDQRLLEAQFGCRLVHDNVVNIKYADVIPHNGSVLVVIVMPYFPRGAVTGHLNSGNFLPLKMGLKCIRDILRGLEHLHANGFYHCDIKPNNILCGHQGEFLLTDYGITCFSPTHSAVAPTTVYMTHATPETLNTNQYDNCSDIYQVGLTMFRLLNGINLIKDVASNSGAEHLDKIKNGKIVADNDYLQHIPNSIKRIIKKAVAFDPEERYQSARDMRSDLEKINPQRDCTTDASGNLIIIDDKNEFRFEIVSKGQCCNIIFYKKNKSSGREVKVSNLSRSNVLQREQRKELRQIMSQLIT